MTNDTDMIYEGSPVMPEPERKQHVCSLIAKTSQVIQPNRYTLLEFPFGKLESMDRENMHPASKHRGLIYPAHSAWGYLHAMIFWERGASEYRDRFVRDPLSKRADSTNSEHRPASHGNQCFAKSWAMFVHPDVPLGLMVAHNASKPLKVTLAEFKLSYRTD